MLQGSQPTNDLTPFAPSMQPSSKSEVPAGLAIDAAGGLLNADDLSDTAGRVTSSLQRAPRVHPAVTA